MISLFAFSACADKPAERARQLLLRIVQDGELFARGCALRLELCMKSRAVGAAFAQLPGHCLATRLGIG